MASRSRRIVLGLNQYTHSASCCLLDEEGRALFALSKERLTRKKFDGGDTAELVACALEATGLRLADLGLVVANNHLFRIRPYEERLPFTAALHAARPTALEPHNLLPGVPHHELSHHLAHAWSVLPYAPFDEGLIVVMDGIGSTLRDVHTPDRGYTSDPDLPAAAGFRQFPEQPDPEWGWREAETVYSFRGLELQRLFKRWICENTPVFLYNYGFEDMESLGAVYSRISSHLFGDWNACGKVMGLAPWDRRWNTKKERPASEWVLKGPLERLKVNTALLRAEPHANEWAEKKRRKRYARLAAGVQADLERVVLAFLKRLRKETGARNLCLTGGVALNSTLNGRIAREAGFEQVFIPPYPGDEGVAVGCAAFGHHALGGRAAQRSGALRLTQAARPARAALSPFLGRSYVAAEIDAALADFAPFVKWERSSDPADAAARALADKQVVAWFQGRSEFGPRALGNRSLLAHPGAAKMVDHLNLSIKKREDFRPFAPTVLAERAAEWFGHGAPSPYMSLTAPVAPGARKRIPAVVHVDGSARLQTLAEEENPRFHALIRAFEKLTGLPLVLNTSFNVAGEPIVESPADALTSFHEGGIDLLVLEDRLVTRRPFPDRADWNRLRPLHRPEVRAEVRSDARGETEAVTFLAGGFVREADELGLGVLETCTGEQTVNELAAAFESEYEVPPEAFLEALGQLFSWRLVEFLGGA